MNFGTESAPGLAAGWVLFAPRTSAGGRSSLRPSIVLLGIGLGFSATSAAEGMPVLPDQVMITEQTTAGRSIAAEAPRDHAADVAVIRQISGLTWEQLAQLFEVSRRAVHLWASGARLSDRHAAHVERIADVFRTLEGRNVARVRTALATKGADGVAPLELLAAGRYDEAARRLAERAGPMVARAPAPSAQAIAERRPSARPDELVGALQDRPHESSGKLRRAIPIGRKRA